MYSSSVVLLSTNNDNSTKRVSLVDRYLLSKQLFNYYNKNNVTKYIAVIAIKLIIKSMDLLLNRFN